MTKRNKHTPESDYAQIHLLRDLLKTHVCPLCGKDVHEHIMLIDNRCEDDRCERKLLPIIRKDVYYAGMEGNIPATKVCFYTDEKKWTKIWFAKR